MYVCLEKLIVYQWGLANTAREDSQGASHIWIWIKGLQETNLSVA